MGWRTESHVVKTEAGVFISVFLGLLLTYRAQTPMAAKREAAATAKFGSAIASPASLSLCVV